MSANDRCCKGCSKPCSAYLQEQVFSGCISTSITARHAATCASCDVASARTSVDKLVKSPVMYTHSLQHPQSVQCSMLHLGFCSFARLGLIWVQRVRVTRITSSGPAVSNIVQRAKKLKRVQTFLTSAPFAAESLHKAKPLMQCFFTCKHAVLTS